MWLCPIATDWLSKTSILAYSCLLFSFCRSGCSRTNEWKNQQNVAEWLIGWSGVFGLARACVPMWRIGLGFGCLVLVSFFGLEIDRHLWGLVHKYTVCWRCNKLCECFLFYAFIGVAYFFLAHELPHKSSIDKTQLFAFTWSGRISFLMCNQKHQIMALKMCSGGRRETKFLEVDLVTAVSGVALRVLLRSATDKWLKYWLHFVWDR